MVRCTVGMAAKDLGAELPGQRQHGRRFERGGQRHWRQQAWQAAGEHRLAGTRRAGEEERVRAGGSDFQPPLGLYLSAYLAEVRVIAAIIGCRIGGLAFVQRSLPGQVCADVEQRARRQHPHLAGQSRFAGTAGRENEAASHATGGEDHGQRAADRPQFTGERQFTGKFMVGQRRTRNLTGGGENAERDRQIEAPRFLGQLGWREVDGNALAGKIEARVLQCRTYPIACLLDLRIGQPDQGEARQAAPRDAPRPRPPEQRVRRDHGCGRWRAA
jgi:hypothetical protein